MKILRESSENEMILEFLKAESTSERFSAQLKDTMEKLGFSEKLFRKQIYEMKLKIRKESRYLQNFADMDWEGSCLKISQRRLLNGVCAVFQYLIWRKSDT